MENNKSISCNSLEVYFRKTENSKTESNTKRKRTNENDIDEIDKPIKEMIVNLGENTRRLEERLNKVIQLLEIEIENREKDREEQREVINGLRELIESWNEKTEELKLELEYKNQRIIRLEERVENLKKSERDKNMFMKGIREKEIETEEDRKEMISKIMVEKLKIGEIEIEECRGVGFSKEEGRSRPILLRCKNKQDTKIIMKKKGSLKETEIYITCIIVFKM